MINNLGRKIIAAGTSILVAVSVVGLGVSAANAAESNTLTIWATTPADNEAESYKVVADNFAKAYPQYKVVFVHAGSNEAYMTALSTALQAGNGPDVFKTSPGQGQVDSTITLARAKFLYDLSGTKAKTFNPAAEAGNLAIGSKVYALGLGLTVGTTLYNKTMYEKDGLGAWPTTFAGILKACAAAKAQGKTLYALAGAMQANAGISIQTMVGPTYKDSSWTAKRLARKVTFANDPGWRNALNRLVSMNQAGCFQAGAGASQVDGLINGFFGHKAYAVFAPASLAVAWGGAFSGEKLSAAYIPEDKAADTLIPASTNYAFSVNAKTKAPTAAKAFINYMTGAGAKTFQKLTGYFGYGVSTSSQPEYAIMLPFLKAKKTYPLPNASFPNAEVYAALAKGVQALLLGQVSIGKTLSAMDAAW